MEILFQKFKDCRIAMLCDGKKRYQILKQVQDDIPFFRWLNGLMKKK